MLDRVVMSRPDTLLRGTAWTTRAGTADLKALLGPMHCAQQLWPRLGDELRDDVTLSVALPYLR